MKKYELFGAAALLAAVVAGFLYGNGELVPGFVATCVFVLSLAVALFNRPVNK